MLYSIGGGERREETNYSITQFLSEYCLKSKENINKLKYDTKYYIETENFS